MSVPAEVSTRWASFHLSLPGPLEPFLAGHLLPFLERERAAETLRRFFFIRYGVGQPHLRLRLLPRAGIAAETLRARLEETVRAYVEHQPCPGAGYSVEAHPYSRSELYFGETAATVYAELLNEATSRLCLELLLAPGADHWARRWLSLAATLQVLLESSSGSEEELRCKLAESRAFARRAASGAGFDLPNGPRPPHPSLDTALLTALSQLEPALAPHPTVRRISRLLRRARRYVPEGAQVAIHALHLLCNKLGFSLHEEHEIFTALQRMRAPRPCAQPGTAGRPADPITEDTE
ncbi:MAG TPA: thiopeptide-type bacteriocin biosynthesis protein [Longimicrobiaceae bacterium]|nr:thiopeptide-type bacteriocin biosynthesis protein [Longimicrobiaceae bacterium]